MKLIKSVLFALLFSVSLPISGCYLDEVAVEPVVIYRVGFGYGYWHQGYWYAAPPGYVYRPGRPYWGPHYRGPVRPLPPPPPPPYRGPRGWPGRR